ncbi:MAG: hypothetical protein NTW47_21830 [Proteobacteria bacterium]|nr:hypothetical protein [Pseudomonadota bacterium]
MRKAATAQSVWGEKRSLSASKEGSDKIAHFPELGNARRGPIERIKALD